MRSAAPGFAFDRIIEQAQRMRPLPYLLFSAALVACGISLDGTFDADADKGADGGPADASTQDSGQVADASISLDSTSGQDSAPLPDGARPDAIGKDVNAPDAPLPPDASCDPPAGWTRAEVITDGSECSVGMDNDPTPAFMDPVAAGTCACGACQITQPQNCAPGTLTLHVDNDNNGTCGAAAVAVPTNGGCNPLTENVKHVNVTPPAATGGGTCEADGMVDRSKLQMTSVRLCHASAGSCAGSCIAHNGTGDVECPVGRKISLVFDPADIKVACGACNCTVASTACGGAVTFYSSNNCTSGASAPLAADAGCTPVSTFHSLKYSPDPSATCDRDPDTDPDVSLTNVQTVCCL